MDVLRDKVAIITGAGDGIGRGIARRFAAEGGNVVIAEINPRTGQPTATEIEKDFHTKALFVKADVSIKEDVLAMVDNIGQLRAARTNARLARDSALGDSRSSSVDSQTEGQFEGSGSVYRTV